MLKPSVLVAFVLSACACHVASAAIPVYGFIVKNTYPHDPKAFTQGLFFRDGHLYESTGLTGQSTLRRVELKTGKVLQKTALPQDVFGEGSTAIGDSILGLTWQAKTGYIFDAKTLAMKGRFPYEGEGWGLASDAKYVYMSDGSASIRVLDPKTLKEVRRVPVSADGKPIDSLNELEMVDGELYANVWGTDVIARIDPASGKVVGWIDLSGLLPREKRGTGSVDAVLNGIAYDAKTRRLYVTGKLWPKLFEIELVKFEGR
ncbi:glutaminyl-peptide cyclotransferase [Massilia sp. Dwa41.01b]|uniref:glutaminyl-peptide cyclotransferase n=1 Tax=unclassified Massilia TaxID=2609279 RepID=UPI00160499D4|nr:MULTISPECIES: glutaminyl-peptide cyclotransferase [unclassified Massilia]QNA87295.1 glutaminyl-peptide cyclotransferase [Massilia sp. Dwa41.01b]QNA98200.1 glutaminyl-peptide cyclotransferase [Massilia sp. Se16.2.3]